MKYNIAISGTFNVENYGDLMFPVIFKKAMEKRGLDFELFLFSPERSCKKALDETTTVYAISEIDKIHSEHPLNAVIVGGGALIHYNNISVKFPGEDKIVDYNIGESWYYPIEFSVRNNIKLLFNLPQVPYSFADSLKDITRAAFNCCDYISLRDDMSKQYLIDVYGENSPKIDVYPDSVCCISELISYDELSQIRNNLISFKDNYAVIQFNPQKPQNDDKFLAETINCLRAQGLRVVLLPIGYTHSDDLVLKKFNEENQTQCEIIEKKLSILETASVLAGCDIYIGSSFHGAITAMAYGKKAISYNYIYPKNKNQEIFRMYGVPEFAVDTAEDVYKLVCELYDEKISFNPDTQSVLTQLNQYFDNLCDMIKQNKTNDHSYYEFVKPVIKSLPQLSKLEREQEHLQNLVQMHLEEIERCGKYISDLEQNNNSQNEYIKLLESNLDATRNQLEKLQTFYNKIKNNFFVRILLWAKRLFTKNK